MNNARPFSRLAICLAAALAPLLAAAQPGDEFASNGGRGMPFANVPDQHPNCAGPVQEYWAKTEELDALFEQRKQSVNPEASELSREINETAKERGEIGDEIIECVKDDVAGARPPPLEGQVDQLAPFELRAEEAAPEEPIVFRELTPQLDTREPAGGSEPPGPGPGGGEPRVVLEGTPKLLPPGSQPPTVPIGGGDGGGATEIDLDVRGKIVGTGGHPGGPGGTVVNDFTRKYAFAQGMLLGVGDAGQTAGGRFTQLMLASGYLVLGDPQKAQAELGLVPGQSVTLADLQKDLEAFSDIINRDPAGTDLAQSLEDGRTVGKKLTELFMGKYAPPSLQPPSQGGVIDPFAVGATAPAAR